MNNHNLFFHCKLVLFLPHQQANDIHVTEECSVRNSTAISWDYGVVSSNIFLPKNTLVMLFQNCDFPAHVTQLYKVIRICFPANLITVDLQK